MKEIFHLDLQTLSSILLKHDVRLSNRFRKPRLLGTIHARDECMHDEPTYASVLYNTVQ